MIMILIMISQVSTLILWRQDDPVEIHKEMALGRKRERSGKILCKNRVSAILSRLVYNNPFAARVGRSMPSHVCVCVCVINYLFAR